MNPIEILKNEHEAVRLTLRILDTIVATALNELNGKFEKIETEKIGVGRHEAFHRMIDKLKDVYLG
jgi:hypothetical protein